MRLWNQRLVGKNHFHQRIHRAEYDIIQLLVRSLTVVAIFAIATPAFADQQYVLSGFDRYRVGAGELNTNITYSGKETLTVAGRGHLKHYTVRANYTRSAEGGRSPGSASFAAMLLPSGEQRDESNGDPNYLTVLNQPFSIQLDAQTLRDLSHLQGGVPFDFPSPVTGGTLRGFLRRGPSGQVAGRQALGVAFDAQGAMRGPLPDHPSMRLSGTIAMRGIAYYELDSSLLLALDATLTISGKLDNARQTTPVTIVYKRTITVARPAPTVKEAATPR
ncbi:MAG: hypothetical protein JO024_05935 [Candidatus Eremiobacteraeota bacterium]|nr:hypothetical protein [Candidatus Eremiobacteraeota bacterium]